MFYLPKKHWTHHRTGAPEIPLVSLTNPKNMLVISTNHPKYDWKTNKYQKPEKIIPSHEILDGW